MNIMLQVTWVRYVFHIQKMETIKSSVCHYYWHLYYNYVCHTCKSFKVWRHFSGGYSIFNNAKFKVLCYFQGSTIEEFKVSYQKFQCKPFFGKVPMIKGVGGGPGSKIAFLGTVMCGCRATRRFFRNEKILFLSEDIAIWKSRFIYDYTTATSNKCDIISKSHFWL